MALRVTRQNTEILAPGASGTLRVTRQNVELLAPGNGRIRVTRQNIEILSEVGGIVYERSITDPITFAQDFETERTPIHIVDTLNFVQVADGWGPRTQYIDDPITFSQIAHISITYELNVIDTITFNQEASYAGLNNQIINDSIIFNQVVDAGITNIKYTRNPNNWIDFEQNAVIYAHTKGRDSTDIINFNQEVKIIGPIYLDTSNNFIFNQTLTGILPHYAEAESNLLETTEVFNEITFEYDEIETGLRDSASYIHDSIPSPVGHFTINDSADVVLIKTSAIACDATSIITFIDSCIDGPSEIVNDIIIFNQVASCVQGKFTSSILTFEQVVELQKLLVPSLTSDLSLVQSASYTLLRAGTLCTYSPFIGGNSDPTTPAPPNLTGPTLVKHKNIQLTYPADVPTSTLTLRGPEFGNKDRSTYQRINRESRGGTLIIFVDPIWPKIQTMVIEFYALSEIESQEALTFISNSLGKVIGIRDWEGREWRGIITTADNPIVRNGKNNNSISLELDIFSILDWHTFLDEEWRLFTGFDWDFFLGE